MDEPDHADDGDDDALDGLGHRIDFSLDTADIDPTVLTKLHLKARDYENPGDADAPDFRHDLERALCSWVHDIISKKKRNTGSGFSGWNYRGLYALFHDKSSDSYHSYLPIAKLVVHILTGKLAGDECFAPFTGIARGIALKKPNGKPRPIGIMEVLMRIAGTIGTRLFRPQLMGAMHKHDFGHAPDGPGVLAQTIRALLARPDHAVISLDCRNAFNEASTVAAIEHTTDAVPQLRPLAQTFYAQPRLVSYAPDPLNPVLTVETDRGVIQGEGYAPLIFGVTYSRTVTQELRVVAVLPNGVFIFTLHDDTYIVGPFNLIFGVADRHEHVIYEKLGLSRQPAKEAVLYCGNDAAVLASITADAAQRGMRVETNGLVIAGVPVGSDAFVTAHVSGVADGLVNGLLPRIRRMIDESGLAPRLAPQGVAAPPAQPPVGQGQADLNALEIVGKKGFLQRIMHLLRACVASRFLHLMRGVEPSRTGDAARRIDTAVYETVMYVAGLHRDALPTGVLGAIARARVFLPVSMTGLGFMSCERARYSAYAASVFNAAPHLNSAVPLMSLVAGGGNSWAPVFAELTETLETLRTAQFGGDAVDSLANKLHCNEASALRAHPATHQLQGNLMKYANVAALRGLLAENGATPPAHLARMRSSGDRHANAWLLSSGGHPLLQMPNIAFRDSICFLLGLSLTGMAPPLAGSGATASYNMQLRSCRGCHSVMTADGCHGHARATCRLAASAAGTHALLAGTIRSAVISSGSAHVRLAGDGAEGGAIAEVLEFKNPLPAGVAVGPDGRPATGLRADMRLQLGAPGGEGDTTIFADVVVTAAVPIAIQPVTGANGWPELPVIPPRLLSRTGAAAADGERDKNKLYGDRYEVPPRTIYPLSFEVHGSASSSTHAFFERVAQTVFPGVGEGGIPDFGGRRAAFISMLRQRTSVALQTANAKVIARWRRLCWSSSAPVGAAAAPG